MKKIMTTTELRPLTPNLSIYNEEEEESLEGGEVAPLPGKDAGSGDEAGGNDDGGLGPDEDLIEAPGEEEF